MEVFFSFFTPFLGFGTEREAYLNFKQFEENKVLVVCMCVRVGGGDCN